MGIPTFFLQSRVLYAIEHWPGAVPLASARACGLRLVAGVDSFEPVEMTSPPNKKLNATLAERLRKLEGDAFQQAIVVALGLNVGDFQTIPDKPSGDGGVDGLSHGQSIAYCCYGPELAVAGLTPGEIAKRIVKKFDKDLQRILEVKRGKTGCIKKTNDQLAAVMGKQRKIGTVQLISSWFEDHTIIGKLTNIYDDLVQHSDKRFVSASCSVVIAGPNEIAAKFYVDDRLLLAIEQPEVLKILDDSASQPAPPPQQADFDAKFAALAAKHPGRTKEIAALRDNFLADWSRHLARIQNLADKFPHYHRRVVAFVEAVINQARIKSLGKTATEATNLIADVGEELRKRAEVELQDVLPPAYHQKFTDGALAALIGECPVDWRS